MENLFAKRTLVTHKSFIREILKVTEDPQIISFAGGLPNPDFFPIDSISKACTKVLGENGRSVLQYSTTEGFYPLRQYIADRYLQKKGLKIDPNEILITNGSQQGLDLIGKVFLDKGDRAVIERPGYLGAIQSFSIYEPEFIGVPLCDDGIDTALLEYAVKKNKPKIFYTVPNFQNPSGITYSKEKRLETAEIIQNNETILVEDDPYGELRFAGEDLSPIKNYVGSKGILLGSFSKIVAPGLRLGWICADKVILEKIIIAKQASDLHTNCLSQRIVYQYLMENEIDGHISKIKEAYGKQRSAMLSAMERYFPEGISYTRPEGGMFLWITLPEGIAAMELFQQAIKQNVAFVPGDAFYVNGKGANTLRLNFSNSDEVKIEEGIKRLGKAIKRLMMETLTNMG